MVLILWATIITVFPFTSSESAACTWDSHSVSRDAVASSSRIICASLSIALAMDILCLSPPESFEPFSPIEVS